MKQLNWYQIFGNTHKIPDGATVLPTDDIQIWLHCANIWDKTYTTLAEVLADTTTLAALIASENAVDYMVRSTTWAVSMTVPAMTSATTPSGKVTASSQQNTTRAPWKAFNGIMAEADDCWEPYDRSSDHSDWIDYEFPTPVKLSCIEYYLHNVNRDCTYRIQGSNDGITYTDLKVCSNVRMKPKEATAESVDNFTDYYHIRVYFDNMPWYGSSYYYLVGSFQFYGISIPTNSTAMSLIGLNNYCTNTLIANSTWRTAISESPIFNSVLNIKNPVMTSNTTPSGVASASSSYSGGAYPPWRAFMGYDISSSSDYGWASASGQNSAWLQYEFASACHIFFFRVSRHSSVTLTYKFDVVASNDGVNFTDLATEVNVTKDGVVKVVTTQDESYKYYRFKFTSTRSGSAMSAGDGIKVRLFGREDVA